MARRFGSGVQTDQNGSTYDGGWADDRKEGQGKWTGPNNEVYDGNWHSDKVCSFFFIWSNSGVTEVWKRHVYRLLWWKLPR